ncbi:hypothetical protein LZ31DRAFT_552979, partial [Colletotrichum somersetense]
NALRASTASAQPRSGRPAALSHEEEQQLVEYVTSSHQGRLASFLQLSVILFKGAYGEYTIRSTLCRLGYRRYTIEDWITILWTDETWVNGSTYQKVYMTRRADKELDPTCLI